MSTSYFERIFCDNPDCLVYADELIREAPGRVEVRESVRSLVTMPGWVHGDGWDLCPAHVSNAIQR
jgi:hypothetical protein